MSKEVIFEVNDFSGYPFSVSIDIDGYDGNTTLSDFPVYLELNQSISGFSYEQFSSSYGHDLRFLSGDASEELKYEVVQVESSGYFLFLGSTS